MRVSAEVTYINIEPEDGVLLARALEACYFGLKLVLGLGLLRAVSMIALGLVVSLLTLRRSLLLLLLRCLALVPLILRLGSRRVAVLRCRVWSAVRVLVAHVAIVLRVLSVWRRLRRERRRVDVVGGRLAKARPVVLRGRRPWIVSCWVVRIVRGVVHGGDSNWNTTWSVDGLTSCLAWVAVCCSVERLGSLVHDRESASSLHSHVWSPAASASLNTISCSLNNIGYVACMGVLCSSSRSTQCKST